MMDAASSAFAQSCSDEETAEVFAHGAGWWYMRWLSGDGRLLAMRAFGTAEIPTPFTTDAPRERVLAFLRKANPRTTFVSK